MNPSLPAGTKLGRYQIRSRIGAGGMGEVYLADDTLMRRPAAVKVLTGNYVENVERLHRFEREAYAASSLNHPNIVTIYEIGSEAGYHFIVTEFVDGQSLRELTRSQPIDLKEVVELGVQVTSALNAAHEAGIIHRDIKPENIMMRRDGYVKVLDFGLAKLTDELWASDTDAEAATQLLLKTEPGRIMGTIDYMSPEQARGRAVDQRSDIFSLGVVLYELAAGTKPFDGETKSDVLAAVLTAEPVSLGQRRPDIPIELTRIVNKCLRKNRDERYQSAKELLVDLKSLRQELELATKLGLSTSTAEVSSTSAVEATNSTGPILVTKPGRSYPTTISELFIKEVKTHPRRTSAVFFVISVALISACIGLYKLVKLAGRTDSFQNMRLAKLTSSGDASAIAVAVSPDGNYVVYATTEAGHEALVTRQVATSSNVQIVPAADVLFTGITFSPDGSYVYYTIEEKQQFTTLYQIPVLGGVPRKLIDDALGPVTFSPDGSRFAFRRDGDTSEILIANADGSGVRKLAARPSNEIWTPPSWSPDNKVLVAAAISLADTKARLIEIALTDGKERILPTAPWLSVTSLAWLSDGTGFVLTGRDTETKLFQVWFVSYPDGKARRITNDLNSYAGVSLTADGKRLVSVQGARVTSLWVAPNGNADLATKITFDTGKDEGLSGLSSTPDGKIVHTERNAGSTDLWIMNNDGQNNVQLTMNAGRNYYPNVTPDGRYVVFISDRGGRNDIWRVDIDGRNPFQLTNFASINSNPSVSPDGKWVFYQATVDKTTTIWKSSIDGGQPIKITHSSSSAPLVGPHGTLICQYGEKSGSSETPKFAFIPLNGGEPEKLIDLPNVIKGANIRFSSKGDALIYRESKNRIDNLWSQALNGDPPKQVTDFKSDQIFAFDWTRDGKQLVLARGRQGSDIVMVTNFR